MSIQSDGTVGVTVKDRGGQEGGRKGEGRGKKIVREQRQQQQQQRPSADAAGRGLGGEEEGHGR